MVATAVAMAFQLDVRFEERSPATSRSARQPGQRPGEVRRGRRSGWPTCAAGRSSRRTRRRRRRRGRRAPLKDSARRPTSSARRSGSTPGRQPLTLRSLRGRVVLIDFWTYTCINCIRTLPYLKAWDARYRDEGLTIVGVHSPEFEFEKDAGNVAARDPRRRPPLPGRPGQRPGDLEAWRNQSWPAEYLIDARGHVRHVHLGEGEYGETEDAIRALLAEAGAQRLGARPRPRDVVRPSPADHARDLRRRRARRGLRRPPRRPARTRYRRSDRRARAQPLHARRHLGRRPPVGDRGRGRDAQRPVRAKDVYVVLGPPPPRARPATGAACSSPSTGSPTTVAVGTPAALHGRVAAARRHAPDHAAPQPRRLGLLVHVRVGAAARRRSADAAGRPRAR